MKRIAVVIMMLAAASAVAVAQISPEAVGGTGTTNYIPLWTNSTTLGRSILFQNGLNVGLGTTAPLAKFQVSAATPLVTIKGLNTATTGATYGVLGQANSVSGTGVYGKAIATTGAAIGVRGSSASPNGYAGLFTNSAQGIAIKASDGTPVSSPLRPVIQATSLAGVSILGWSTDINAGVGVAGVVHCGATCQDHIRSGSYGMYAYTSQSYTTALLTESGGRALEARAFGDNEGVVATSNNSVGSTISANNGFNGAFALLAGTDTLTDNAYGLRAGGNAGRCTIDGRGNFACTGTKSAIVPISNQKKVALYAVESPENWFEDFGSGNLVSGTATVKLDPVFAETVNLGAEYHVFLTPKGDCKGLFVTSETPGSFEVREIGSGQSGVKFDYRIVARRRGFETVRLADMTDSKPNSLSAMAK
jgi:hypothetical protein